MPGRGPQSMVPYLIDIRYKSFHAKANESLLFGLALGHDHYDACYRLLRREGLTAEGIGLGPETYFDFERYTSSSCKTYHLFNDKQVPYLMVTFDTGANFLRWYLTHHDPQGIRGPSSWWECEGTKCDACLPKSDQPFRY